jgi:hypothetical protein
MDAEDRGRLAKHLDTLLAVLRDKRVLTNTQVREIAGQEEWTVPLDVLPFAPEIGRGFRLVIRRGAYFIFDRQRYWSQRQIDRGNARARKLRAQLVEEYACCSRTNAPLPVR